MLKTQLSALAAATFRMGISTGEDSALQIDTKVVGAFDLWLRKDEDGQRHQLSDRQQIDGERALFDAADIDSHDDEHDRQQGP